MIAIFSDTHSTDGHELEGAARQATRDADVVVHAGDFTSEAALDAFRDACSKLYAVHGNADELAVRETLPDSRVVEHDGLRIALAHRREGGETGLAMFGRSHDADLVVSGHTHRPTVVETDDCVLLNPGSHAQPRGNRPGFATLERTDGGFAGEIREPSGALVKPVSVSPTDDP